MDFVFVTLAFVGGCLYWNYLGTWTKSLIHAEVRKAGEDLKSKL